MTTHPPPEFEKPFRVDEEQTERILTTNGGDHNLPTHVQPSDSTHVEPKLGHHLTSVTKNAWARFNGHGRRRIGFFQSIKAIITSSCTFIPVVVTAVPGIYLGSPVLNALLLFLPFAWLSHFKHWNENMTFACVCHRSHSHPLLLRSRCRHPRTSVLHLCHSFGETLRLVRGANGTLPWIESG